MTALVNGRTGDVDAADRGLAYGDGVFETMAARDGRIRWLEHHLDRLADGCRRLRIPAPDRALLSAEALDAAAGTRHVVKLIVTRGTGARGYAPPATPQPTRIVTYSPWPDYPSANYTRGIRLRTLNLRLGENPALAGVKHLCRLEQVLARMELGSSADEGLLLDRSGFVVGGTGSNVFCVHGTTLATPALERSGVKGVMRRVIIATAPALGLRVNECDFTPDELKDADEVFVSNALFGVWPVTEIDAQARPRGAHTVELMHRLEIAPDA